MRKFGKEASRAVALVVVAAAAGFPVVARAAEGDPQRNPPVPAPRDAGTKPAADGKSSGAPAGAKPAADPKTAPPAPAAPPGPGMWASIDDWMDRTGNKIAEVRVLGLRFKPSLSETLSYTDNAFYQARNERLIVDFNADGVDVDGDGRANARPWFARVLALHDGIDNNGNGVVDEHHERNTHDGIDNNGNGLIDEHNENKLIRAPIHSRGQVAEIVNTAEVAAGLSMPLNSALSPLLDEQRTSIELARGYFTSVEYLKHADSPDAWNWGFSFDVPGLLDLGLRKFLSTEGGKNSFYYRVEGSISQITDPLDVQIFQFAVGGSPTFFPVGGRNTFKRQEWWGKGTLGWKGARFDAKISYKHYDFKILDDRTLSSADHVEQTGYGEIGYSLPTSGHRVYGFYEYTNFNFPDRESGRSNVRFLRDFCRTRTGLGVKGPFLTKKLTGTLELFYLGMDVFNDSGGTGTYPIITDPDTGITLLNPNGTPRHRGFDEATGPGARVELAYRPYSTKSTEARLGYSRTVDWSVVAQNKTVDKGTISLVHPINEKWTGHAKYEVTYENVAYREKRLYQEVGLGLSYKIFKHTTLDLDYSLRYMRSRHEQATREADRDNEIYLTQANGDFMANIVSVGLTVSF